MVNKFGREGRTPADAEVSPVVESETLRSAASHSRIPFTPVRYRDEAPPPAPQKEEEKISLFWRVFGGTILSISALVMITIYNNMASSIADLRDKLANVNEARADLIKKDEFNGRTAAIETRVQDLIGTQAALNGVKEHVSAISERVNAAAKRQEDSAEAAKVVVSALKERLAAIEAGGRQHEKDRTAIGQIQVGLTALQEKSVNRDEQLKQIDAERKSLALELQLFRDRLTKLEVTQDRPPATVRSTTPKPRPTPVPIVAPAVFTPPTDQ